MNHILDILILDDVPQNLITLRALLENNFENINIFEANSANDAMVILLNHEINLILSDIQMPQLDGFEFAKILRSNKRTKDIPLIYLTAIYDSDEYKKIGYLLGAIDYIAKPIDEFLFIQKLSSYVNIFLLQKKLDYAQKYTRGIIESSDDLISVMSKDFTVIDMNNAAKEFFGDIIGMHCFDYENPDIDRSMLDSLKAFVSCEVNFCNKIHETKPTYFKIKDRDFDVKCKIVGENFIFSMRDITILKNQEKILADRLRLSAMGEMISMIAHQWRQPLASLSLVLMNMKVQRSLGMLDDSNFDNMVSSCENQVKYMTKTIDDFRDFYKNSDKVVEISPQEIIDKAYRLSLALFKSNGVALEIEDYGFQDCKHVSIAVSKLNQVIMNIFKNAVDEFVLRQIKEPKIKVIISRRKYDLMLEIGDNAGGIKDDVLLKIFDPYFSTKSKNGTGIGLYMSKMIIEDNLGGKLEAYNQAGGACFKITLCNIFKEKI